MVSRTSCKRHGVVEQVAVRIDVQLALLGQGAELLDALGVDHDLFQAGGGHPDVGHVPVDQGQGLGGEALPEDGLGGLAGLGGRVDLGQPLVGRLVLLEVVAGCEELPQRLDGGELLGERRPGLGPLDPLQCGQQRLVGGVGLGDALEPLGGHGHACQEIGDEVIDVDRTIAVGRGVGGHEGGGDGVAAVTYCAGPKEPAGPTQRVGPTGSASARGTALACRLHLDPRLVRVRSDRAAFVGNRHHVPYGQEVPALPLDAAPRLPDWRLGVPGR